jgi:hypothetical protein
MLSVNVGRLNQKRDGQGEMARRCRSSSEQRAFLDYQIESYRAGRSI